jgi:hypothetical protein
MELMSTRGKAVAIDGVLISLIGVELLLVTVAVLVGIAASTQSVYEFLAATPLRFGAGLVLMAGGVVLGYKCSREGRPSLSQAQSGALILGLASVFMVSLRAPGGGWLEGQGAFSASLICAALAMILVQMFSKRESAVPQSVTAAAEDQ